MMAMTWIPGMSFERYKQRTDVLFDLGEEMRLSTELCFSNATFFRDQNLGVSNLLGLQYNLKHFDRGEM